MPVNSSGQAVLLLITLLAILLVGLTAYFYSNQIGTLHQTASAQRTKGRSVAEDGIAYATQELSASMTTWQNALSGTFPSDCNSGHDVVSPSGGRFQLHCSVGTAGNPGLQPYEIAVTAVASVRSTNGTDTPLRAMKAYVGQRTLGADLANNVHAAVALQLAAQPVVSGTLDVEWGPIVCLDLNSNTASPVPWSVPDVIDSGRYPRKFSVGGITSSVSSYSRSGASPGAGPYSDQREYWAYAPQTDVPLINETYYINQAQMATNITPPKSFITGLPIAPSGCIGAGNTTCGYFNLGPPYVPAGDTAIFDGGGTGYTVPAGGMNNEVIYVNGSAQFNKTAIDGATFIITGQLKITDASGGSPLTLNVPWSANLEYPYYPATPATWPCQGQQGGTCLSTGNIQFRGFLYAKTNVMVNTVGWTMAGALLVGDMTAPLGTSGTLNIPGPTGPSNASMTLYYDDGINHSIQVNPISSTFYKAEPDFIEDVTAF